MKKKEIENLKPVFNFNGIRVSEWFKVFGAKSPDGKRIYYGIESGLRHSDGTTKSPFYYYKCEFGKGAKKRVIKHFTEWWDSKQHKNNNT